jgi:hypothetical protein
MEMRSLLPLFVRAAAMRGKDRDRTFQPRWRDAKRSQRAVVVVRDKRRPPGAIDRDVARTAAAGRHDVLLGELAARRIATERSDGAALAAIRLRIILAFIHRVQRIAAGRNCQERRVR